MVRAARYPEVLLTLGGTIELNETDQICIKRETWEEITAQVEPSTLLFLHEFTGAAYAKTDAQVLVRLYQGTLLNTPTPASEIDLIEYVDSTIDRTRLTDVGKKIIDWLKQEKYIN